MKTLVEIQQHEINNIVKLLGLDIVLYKYPFWGYCSRRMNTNKEEILIECWQRPFERGQFQAIESFTPIININLLADEKVKVLIDYAPYRPEDTTVRNLLVNETFIRKYQERVLDYLTKKGYQVQL